MDCSAQAAQCVFHSPFNRVYRDRLHAANNLFRAAFDPFSIISIKLEVATGDARVRHERKRLTVRFDWFIPGRRFDHDLARHVYRGGDVHQDGIDAQESVATLNQGGGLPKGFGLREKCVGCLQLGF